MSSDLHHISPISFVQDSSKLLHTSFGIIGAGKLGTTLALALHQKGLLSWVVVRNPIKRRVLRQAFEGVLVYDSIQHVRRKTNVILLTVGDKEIEQCSIDIARQLCEKLDGTMVIHCSGTLHADTLEACRRWGAEIVAAHPFETFATSNIRALTGIAWGIECDQTSEPMISNIVRMFGGTPVMLSNSTLAQKSLYHISAVIASNYVSSVLSIAKHAAEISNIEPSLFLPPIVRTTVENSILSLVNNGTPPLTGPISRGDVAVIQTHLENLNEYPDLQRQYCYLGLATAEFALQNLLITPELFSVMKTLFLKFLNLRQI